MGVVTAVVLYVLIWWTVLFAVLPFGTKPVTDADPATGGWRGAPERPRIGRKVVVTTLISTVLFAITYGVIESGLISFRQGWLALPAD